jgi:hypothetical protein
MTAIEIVVMILAICLVLFTIIYNILHKIKGKGGCGCKGGCSGCPQALKCNNLVDKVEDTQTVKSQN